MRTMGHHTSATTFWLLWHCFGELLPMPLNSRSYKIAQPWSLIFLTMMLWLSLFSINSTGITFPIGINAICLYAMFYKSLKSLAPNYLQTKFVNRSSNYYMRVSVNKLTILFPHTNYLKNSFQYSGAFLWKVYH